MYARAAISTSLEVLPGGDPWRRRLPMVSSPRTPQGSSRSDPCNDLRSRDTLAPPHHVTLTDETRPCRARSTGHSDDSIETFAEESLSFGILYSRLARAERTDSLHPFTSSKTLLGPRNRGDPRRSRCSGQGITRESWLSRRRLSERTSRGKV